MIEKDKQIEALQRAFDNAKNIIQSLEDDLRHVRRANLALKEIADDLNNENKILKRRLAVFETERNN